MKKLPICVLGFSAILAAKLLAASEASSPIAWPGRNFENAYPFLSQRLWWKESYRGDQSIKPQLAGAYCVGNGHIFTMLGLQNPLFVENTIFGPSYQEPSLGHILPTWRQGEERIHFSKQSIAWAGDAGMVVTEAEGPDGLVFKAYDCAPRSCQVLIRLWEVENRGEKEQEGLSLDVHLVDAWNSTSEISELEHTLKIHQNTPKRETFWQLGMVGEAAEIHGSSLVVSLPRLKPGERWQGAQVLSSAFEEAEALRQYEQAAQDPLGVFKQAAEEWQAWNKSAARLEVDAPKARSRWAGLGDLLETQKLICRAEQSHSGSFSPLIGYSLAWVRDNNGPILFWLRLGKLEEVRKVTEFFHAAATQLGFLPPALSVDRSTEANPHPDYNTMGMVHSEVPSWVVLQHLWTYLADGDLEHIKKRYPYLKRCLEAQIISESGRMMLQRDETYLWTLQSRTFPYVGYPNGNFGRYAYTPDSAFEWVAAARGLAKVAELIGKQGDAAALREKANWLDGRTRELYLEPKEGYYCPVASFSGERDLIPFANILFNPLWVGSAGPEDEDAKRSVLAGLHYLKGKYNLLKSSPWNAFFVGMNPGQWTYALARLKHPEVDNILDGLLRTASPSGDFAEIVDPKGLNWNIPELGQGMNGRLRPWEGGVNAEAVIYALTGFEQGWNKGEIRLAPYLPQELNSYQLNHLWTREGPIDIGLKRKGKTAWQLNLKSQADADLKINLELWVPLGKVENVSVERTELNNLSIRPSWVKGGGEFAKLELELAPGKVKSIEWNGTPLEEDLSKPSQAGEVESADTMDADEQEGDSRDQPETVSSTAQVKVVEKDPSLLEEPGFGPLPERRFSNAPILYFFSSTMLLKNTGLEPQFYPTESVRHLHWLQARTPTAAVEMDFHISGKEFWKALMRGGPNNGPRSVVIFDRGAFSQGPHTNKPAQFWNDPDVKAAFKEYLQQGGSIILGGGLDSKGQKEASPGWVAKLVGGSFKTEPGEARCLPAEDGSEMVAKLDSLDVIRPGNDDSSREHLVEVSGERWRDQFKLPLWRSNSDVFTTQSGIGFSGWLQFVTKLPKEGRYRLRVWLANHKSSHGMMLEEFKNGHSKRLGAIPDRPNLVKGRFFKALDFYLPENMEPGPHVFRLTCPDNKSEVHTFSIQLMRAEVKGRNQLAELLGFPPDHTGGICKFGLEYSGKWKAPLKLIGRPELAGLLIKRVGKGVVARSEMEVPDFWPLVKTMLEPEKREKVLDYLKD